MQWQLILDLKRKFAGARFRSGTDDRIDLPVAAGVGRVEFALQDVGVQQQVGVQAGQRTHHVVGTEVVVARDVDGRQPAFGHLHVHHSICEFLPGQAHGHRYKTAFTIRSLKFRQRRANPFKTGIRAESAVNIGNGPGDGLRRQGGIARDQIFVHGKPRSGVRGNHVHPGVLFPGIHFDHLQEQSVARQGHRFIAGGRCLAAIARRNG